MPKAEAGTQTHAKKGTKYDPELTKQLEREITIPKEWTPISTTLLPDGEKVLGRKIKKLYTHKSGKEDVLPDGTVVPAESTLIVQAHAYGNGRFVNPVNADQIKHKDIFFPPDKREIIETPQFFLTKALNSTHRGYENSLTENLLKKYHLLGFDFKITKRDKNGFGIEGEWTGSLNKNLGGNAKAELKRLEGLIVDDTKRLNNMDAYSLFPNPVSGKIVTYGKELHEIPNLSNLIFSAKTKKKMPDIMLSGKDEITGLPKMETGIIKKRKGGVVKRALGSPEEGEIGSGIAGDDPYFKLKELDLDFSPFEAVEDLDIFEEARKGGAQEYQTANLLLPFLKLFGKAPKHEIVPIPTPKKDLTKQTRLQKQSLDKEKEKIIAGEELEVFDPSPDVRLEGAVLPEGVPPVAIAPLSGEPLTSVFYADIEKILARPDAPKEFKGHWRTNKETGEKEWATPKDEIWDYFNLHHIRKSEASDYRIPQLLKMFDDEAVITADQIIKQVRNAPITGVKVHGTGHKSGFMNMTGKDIEAKFADQHMEPGYIPGTYGERVLVIPRSKLPGDTGKYPTAFSGENVSYHRFGEGDDEYVIAWTRNSDRMAIVPSKVEGPKVKADVKRQLTGS